ncbi:MAG: galactosyldiacylglycerol synthase [Oscillospiraceae bacterium]|nr:galactosyldiacylglycerol synthase [Oscillospiraceae bacterium]
MRILILTVTAGHGHNTTARAMEEALVAKGVDVVVLDMYKYISRVIYNVVDKGYLFSVRRTPRQFGRAYSSLERRETPRRVLRILNQNRFLAGRLAGFFADYQPEIILVTHVFGAQVLDVLKRQGHLQVPIMGINTDYCIHPFWEDVSSVDYLVTPNELMRYAAERRGMAPHRLLPLGIPVGAKFQKQMDKQEARAALGLEQDKTTILLMGGSMGYGDMLHNVAQIDAMREGYQLVCLTGSNQRLYQELRRLQVNTPLRVQGFTDQVALYMRAADCIITKPGGLSTSEALACGLPMILVSPIPGQEDRNAQFFLNSGAAVLVTKHFPVADAVYAVLGQPSRLEHMREAITRIAKPTAATDIANVAIQVAKGEWPEGTRHAEPALTR